LAEKRASNSQSTDLDSGVRAFFGFYSFLLLSVGLLALSIAVPRLPYWASLTEVKRWFIGGFTVVGVAAFYLFLNRPKVLRDRPTDAVDLRDFILGVVAWFATLCVVGYFVRLGGAKREPTQDSRVGRAWIYWGDGDRMPVYARSCAAACASIWLRGCFVSGSRRQYSGVWKIIREVFSRCAARICVPLFGTRQPGVFGRACSHVCKTPAVSFAGQSFYASISAYS
jgi:hypothetical protein